MESTKWIANAASLIRRIKDLALLEATVGPNREEGEAIQKGINSAFQTLQNPTLPSAIKLRNEALKEGYFVDPRVQTRLDQAESCWGN